MTTIKLKNGSGAPTAGDLAQGEPALDLTNKRLYTEDSGGTVIEVGTNPGTDVTFADNRKAVFGAGSDLQIYHDGTHSNIKESGAGDLQIFGDNVNIYNAAGSQNLINLTSGGANTLFHSGSPKLATTSTGVDVTGTVTADGLTVDGSAVVRSGNTLTLNRTDNAIGGAMSYVAGTGFIFNDANGDGTSFNVGAANRMRIDSSGNVGIGTSSPSTKLHLGGTAPGDSIIRQDSTASGTNWEIGEREAGKWQIFEDDSDSIVATFMSSGNVGIGTSSPSYPLDVKGVNSLGRFASDGTASELQIITPTVNVIGFDTGTSDSLYFGTTGTERMRIDSSGNVKIGTNTDRFSYLTATTANLQIDGGVVFEPGSGNNVELFNYRSTAMLFGNGGAEAMRIDSSGNLLVGKTTTAVTTGCDMRPTGNIVASASADNPLYLNRSTSDGDIAVFAKDGTTVGSIGFGGGAIMYNAASNYGLKFYDAGGSNIIHPATTAGGDKDASVDLGYADSRFKDLYLSGNAQIGDGANLTWGGTYGDGNPTIAASSNFIAFYPEGNVSGEAFRADASGNLLVGTTSLSGMGTTNRGVLLRTDSGTAGYIQIADLGTASKTLAYFQNGNGTVGTIVTSGSATTYNTSSDQRLKENIADAPSASDDIDAIQVRSFDWKADGSHQKYGMVAQELQTVAPEAVSEGTTEEDMMGVDYSKLVPMLVKEIQSLRARVAQLETN
jgi:hypothetical protein